MKQPCGIIDEYNKIGTFEFIYENDVNYYDFIANNPIESKIIFSPSWEEVQPQALVEWIVEDRLPVRLGLQIHKVIWDKDTQGV